ncbi:protein of unknown function [Porphyromonadaceae bacterium KH3R12]|nr:protein of unknown function [Porphyromonadaceae bacterium KH3R12]
MNNIKKQIIFLLFSGISVLLSVACNSTPGLINATVNPPHFEGSFIQEFLVTGWDDNRWNQEMELLKEAGMKYLIYAPSLLTDEKGNTRTTYPSSLSSKEQQNRTLEKCLRSAQKNGIKVFVGLNFNDRWWRVDYDAAWLMEQMEIGNKVADELVALYKEIYPEAMYGWYWVWEVDNLNCTTAETQAILAKALNTNLDHLSKITPDMPFMLSPFMNYRVGDNAEQHKEMWKNVFSQTNFRTGDIFAPQDCVGAGGLNLENLEDWFSQLKEAADSKPELIFWGNIEIFDQRFWISAPLNRVQRQIEIVNKYAKNIICFAYSHYYSPYVVSENYHRSYMQYYKNENVVVENPYKVVEVTMRSTPQGMEITWAKNRDLGSIAGYCIYRDGTLLKKLQITNGNIPTVFADIEGTTESIYEITSYNVLGVESVKVKAIYNQ